jgi:iron complex transport system ATP-binding protein
MNIIEARGVSFGYSGERLLDGVSFGVGEGSFFAIAGPNGAGKSTLLALLSGAMEAQGGEILVGGREIGSYTSEGLAREVAVVRQEYVPVFGYSVWETVMMARTCHYGRFGFERKLDRQVVEDALEQTDTMRFSGRRIGELSGGERQRVFIARAIAQETPVLLLDEPTSFLDLRHQVGIYDLLKRMQRDGGKTIVSVTHEINLAGQYCDDVLVLTGGSEYFSGRIGDVLSTERVCKVFGVSCYSGCVGRGRFFVPLGKYAVDYGTDGSVRPC